MTQKLTDDAVRNLVSIHGVKDDLLSLRAAVRRVLEAKSEMQRQRDIGVLIDAVDELAAEMGGIDKDNSKEQG